MLGTSVSITTQNLNSSGVATPGSAATLYPLDSNASVIGFEVTGTYTGALTPQGTEDGTNWFTIGGTPITNESTAAQSATVPSGATGLYAVNVAGLLGFRLTALAAVTGSATVSEIESVSAAGASALPVPQVTKTIQVDAVTGIAATVGTYHQGDDQNVAGAAGATISAGVAQLQNIAGTADGQREAGIDNSPSLGISTSVTNPKNVGVTTLNGAVLALATTATLALATATVNGVKWTAKVGGIITFEPGTANEESFRIQSVNLGTGVVTFKGPGGAGLANGHGNGTVVTIDTYNVERDISGENDGGPGRGFVVAVEELYNGGAAAGAANYERARFLQGEKAVFTFLTAAPLLGATSIAVNSATGLWPGVGIDIEDGVNGNERVFVRTDYTVGSLNVPLTTGLLTAHNAGSSTNLTPANKVGDTVIAVPSTTNLANGQIIVIEPGTANQEITTVTAFVASTSITVPALKKAHPNNALIVWGIVEYDAFDVYGPRLGTLGAGAEEVEVAGMWSDPGRAPKLLTTAELDGANPSTILATARLDYDPIADAFNRSSNPYGNPANFFKASPAAFTDNAQHLVLAAAGAGVKFNVTTLHVSNSHATVGTIFTLQDGNTTIWSGFVPALSPGFPITLPVPLQGSANTALNGICGTTGSNVLVNVAGYKSL